MSTARTSVDGVLDPGLAVGPLAAALRPGRATWDVELEDRNLVCVPAVRPYVLALLAEKAHPLLVVVPRTSDAQGLADAGFSHCTPIQMNALPLALDGHDVAVPTITSNPGHLGFCRAYAGRARADPENAVAHRAIATSRRRACCRACCRACGPACAAIRNALIASAI